MGTFAELFSAEGAKIPEEKREEFLKRVEKVYQAGGMMNVEHVQICGKKVVTLRKAELTEGKMNFYYNYFEDACWENAGVGADGVWSNKIGWSYFHQAVVAAYVLEELYTEGVAATMVDGELVESWGYVAWINYLFQEQYHLKNFDPWKVYETLHKCEKEYYGGIPNFGDKRYAFIGGCELYAVENGTSESLEVYEKKEKGVIEDLAFRGMDVAVNTLREYIKVDENAREVQLANLLKIIRFYYEAVDEANVISKYGKEWEWLLKSLDASDAPALIIKTISEIYDEDFWELWEEIKDVARRKSTNLFGNERYYIIPISTEKFFGQSPDDMIIYWEENCDLEFSPELKEWFNSIKNKFDEIMNIEFSIDNPIKYIVSLMEEADDNYYQIYAFSTFFEETLENLNDKKYQALWRLFEEMLREPELKKAGDIIFVPEGPEYENMGIHYWGEQPRRRLIRSWSITEKSKKNNKARMTFRRYMALVANKELRQKVLGF